MGGQLLVMGARDLVALANRDFWAYCAMVLDERSRRDLEEACRKVGVAVSHLPPSPTLSAADFCVVLRAAFTAEGAAFLHHAGYLAGGNAARRVEANLPNPNAGAARLVREAQAAWPNIVVEGKAPMPTRYEVVVASGIPLGPAAVAYASGFGKGAAKRLNEGAPPSLRETTADGLKRWTLSIDWAADKRRPRAPPTRAGRKRCR